ncbi:hypothetical protein OAN13_01855 [Opitutales bacterium]|nr:hypothetical protein [Opitutales bacterium]
MKVKSFLLALKSLLIFNFAHAAEAPIITSNSGAPSVNLSISENTIGITTITALDQNGNSLIYSISGGEDQNHFVIGASTGVLKFANAQDFENPNDDNLDNIYVVKIRATVSSNENLYAEQTISVTVEDINEKPRIIDIDGYIDPNPIPNFFHGYRYIYDYGADDYVHEVENITAYISGNHYHYGSSSGDKLSKLTYKYIFQENLVSAKVKFRLSAAYLDGPFSRGKGTSSAWASKDGLNWVELLNVPEPSIPEDRVYVTFEENLPESLTGGKNLYLQFRMQFSGFDDYKSAYASFSSASQTSNENIFYLDAKLAKQENSEILSASLDIKEKNLHVAQIHGFDPDANQVTFRISGGKDASSFFINPQNGTIEFKELPLHQNPSDSDLDNIYEIEITAKDSNGVDSSPLKLSVSVIRRIIFVDSSLSESGTGLSWETAINNLQDALKVSEDGDTIWLKEGTYYPDIGSDQVDGNKSATFRLKNGVVLIGGFLGNETEGPPQGEGSKTILSGKINSNKEESSYHVIRCIDLNSSKTLIRNLTIRDGRADQDPNEYWKQLEHDSPYHTPYGGGIQIINSKITFSDCIFEENSAVQYRISNSAIGGDPWTYLGGYGGAVYSTNSEADFVRCEFQQNSSEYLAGAVYIRQSNVNFEDCDFFLNESKSGGAGCFSGSSVIFTKSTFTQNQAETGGAFYGQGNENISFVNCVFDSNLAIYEGDGTIANGSGGAIYLESSSSKYENCIFYKNFVSTYGGAIFSIFENSSKIINSLFLENSAAVGGSIYVWGSDLYSANSIFWDNYVHSLGGSSHGIDFSNFIKNSQNHANLLQDKPNVPGQILSEEPTFVNVSMPKGPDGIWLTNDDGLRLRNDSVAVDYGTKDSLLEDTIDLDNDGNTTEGIPYDLIGKNRTIGEAPDLGPYEFDPSSLILNIHVRDTTRGSVIGSGKVAVGQQVQLIAAPNHGYEFESWGQFSSEKSNSISTVVMEDIFLDLNFKKKFFNLSMSQIDGGVITQSNSSGTYEYLSEVNIIAAPSIGFEFEKWLGDISGNENPKSFIITNNQNISAQFSKIQYSIVENTDHGGSVSGIGIYDHGSQVTLSAIPEDGFMFVGWGGDAKEGAGFLSAETLLFYANRTPGDETEPSSISVNVTRDINISAQFSKIQYSIVENTDHGGSVSGIGIYDHGSQVTLSAIPKDGFMFVGWGGDAKEGAGFLSAETLLFYANRAPGDETEPSSISVNVTRDINVSAVFSKNNSK